MIQLWQKVRKNMQRQFIAGIVRDEVMTASEVADLLGVTRQQLVNLEKKKRLLPVVQKKGINLYIKCDVEEYQKIKSKAQTIIPQPVIGHGVTQKCYDHIKNELPNKGDIEAIFIYFNYIDAIMDGVYTTYEIAKRDQLMKLNVPTFIVKYSNLNEVWYEGLNCGYGGTGPHGSVDVLTKFFDVPKEIAEQVFYAKYMKLYREGAKWRCICDIREAYKNDGKSTYEIESFKSVSKIMLFNNKLVLLQEKSSRYWNEDEARNFLNSNLSFISYAKRITIYPRDLAIKTGHYINSSVGETIYQIVIEDVSGRELWLNNYVDENTPIHRQDTIGEILRKLDFDVVEDYKKQGVLKRTIKEIFERKIDVLNLYQDQAYQIIRKSNNII